MRKRTAVVIALTLTTWLAGNHPARGQYYNTGQPPASQRWDQILTDSLRMIFPQEFDSGARRTLYYMEAARPYIGYGFRFGPMKTPVVIHTENFLSNGLAILAPRRIEMGALPAIDTYANPWLKQLAVHEYRHMVQYGNINRSTVRALSYVFGQQAALLATGVMPFWFLEGDAVMAETQSSEFGRGLQPSYTMHYRAAADELTARRNPDKWFCGSYADYVPSHYELGYQLVAHSERKYGKYIWDDVARYGANFPFLLFTTQLSLRKYYDTSTRKLFRETFSYLDDYWSSLPARDDSATAIARPGRAYTAYEHPVFTDSRTVIALKTDYDRSQRFVKIDLATGAEEHLRYTGSVSTRPAYADGRIWWTEYRPTIWEQRVNSVICYMDEGEWKPRTLGGERAAMFPTPVPGGLAYVRYNFEGSYTIVMLPNPSESAAGAEDIYTFGEDVSLHGLAYDDQTRMLYYIALGDNGMWIGSLTPLAEQRLYYNPATGQPQREHVYRSHQERIMTLVEKRLSASSPMPDDEPVQIISEYVPIKVTAPSLSTISGLRAGGGKLYFGSIASGYDEAHVYDLATGCESRISTSRYGSFTPAPSPDGKRIAITVYGRNGYSAAVQSAEPVADVAHSRLPENAVNPPIADWNAPKMDDVVFTGERLEESREKLPSRRYRRAANLFNLHSWAPADFDPQEIMNNFDFNVNAGVTLLSQNLLNTATSSVAYGYMAGGTSLVRAGFTYLGLAPKFEANAYWSDSGQRFALVASGIPRPDPGRNYFTFNTRVYLPIVLTTGYFTSSLVPNVQYVYRNDIAYDISSGEYRTGQHLTAGSLAYSGGVSRARLDLQSRWGYLIRVTGIAEPARNIYIPTVSVFARAFTPGLFRHHALSLSGAYQWAFGEGFSPYSVLDILPRGANNLFPRRYAAVSANYTLPIAYPDWGLSGVFFLQRISVSLGGDYARFETGDANGGVTGSLYSYGGTLRLDITPLRLPSQGTCALNLGLYAPSDAGAPYFSVGFSIPL